ncbi:MAG TPA: TIGR04283 family arsenosugar biosynthesis glycosyltransferase [Solimonas sp.]|nr:TIGR04283 family arsenosugar biosynthesis glycosyltransferase [Solimonas sp.]
MNPARLSIIIPALDEAAALPALLDDLRAQQGVELQLIVADGGSTDATVALAGARGAEVVSVSRGRGRQMNAGRRAARQEWLLFLHADSRLPTPLLLRDALVAMAAQDSLRVAGHFPLRFQCSAPGHELLFRYMEGKTRLNRPYTINGDQGLLIRGEWLDALGGFEERPLEDFRIAARIFEQGRWLLLPGELLTSARRFETEGHAERYTLMALMTGLLAGGVEEFFERAPQAYRTQAQAARLDLRPFVRLAQELLQARGWRGAAGVLLRAGAFVRANAWQLFYRRDVLRGDGNLRCLAFHDRRVRPLIAHIAGDALAGLAIAAWLWGWLPWRLRRR